MPMPGWRDALPQDYGLWIMLCLAVLLGGGGRGYALYNLAVQLGALLILAFSFPQVRAFFSVASWPLKSLVCLTIALPVIQLIPLPPALWSALPGRDLVMESFTLIGEEDRWFPISVAPSLTRLAAIGLIAPFTVLILSTRLDFGRRVLALQLFVGLGLVNVLIGATQLITNGATKFYSGGQSDDLFGSFANHNSSGFFLVVALCAVIELMHALRPKGVAKGWYIAISATLALSVTLSQSRSSMGLLIVPMILAITRLTPYLKIRSWNRQRVWIGAAAILLCLAGAAAMILQSGRVEQSFSRFDSLEDARPGIWEDSWASRKRFWPVGAGMGTFDEVFQLDESLENLRPQRAGRAHNDYLEIMVESGIIGPLMIVLWATYLIWVLRGSRNSRTDIRFGLLAIITCFALQSGVDYPMRSQALLCIAALAIGLLEATRRDEAKGNQIASVD
ncbi:O-antigen ligase domain-containing protein [Altericroceibacterium spongiae]|uniref:O-antigen ligase domain-containing protein n=1 Tax=Altericroceibacterium spongiae TaxID=2320269 RepID=A0A420EE66_9SPHN|nr:O-antigen ligase family protein [Altericroceibacterium spongiae]RKF18932.1 O-antigen ligase domain-containing protein [Altericroceibacterium spongiae]